MSMSLLRFTLPYYDFCHPSSSLCFSFRLSFNRRKYQAVTSPLPMAMISDFSLLNFSRNAIINAFSYLIYYPPFVLLSVHPTLVAVLHTHISKALAIFSSCFLMVYVSRPYKTLSCLT